MTRLALTRPSVAGDLPLWPIVLPFAGYPVAWLAGLGDLIFVCAALVMIVLLVRRHRRLEWPPRFAVWLGFVALMLCSVAAIDGAGRFLGFGYRAALYVSLSVLALYLWAARDRASARFLLGTLTTFWVVVVAGGWLGMLFPLLQITTPLALVLPSGIVQNELVHEMVFRRTTQFDPDAYTAVSPRPSAPFLYTNGWGMAYALLLPPTLGYLQQVRHERRFAALVLILVASLAPALATLNRGMLLGLAVAAVFATARLIAFRHLRVAGALTITVLATVLVFPALPTTRLLAERLAIGDSTDVRHNLYLETWQRTLQSPVLGFGAPRPSLIESAPSAGTQGQLWMVLFSHGIPAAVVFVAFFALVVRVALRRRDSAGLAYGTTLIVFLVEIAFYGALASGLAIALVCAVAAGIRERPRGAPAARPIDAFGAHRVATEARG